MLHRNDRENVFVLIPPQTPRASPKSCEDLSEIENKSCAQKRPSRPQRADQNPGETNASNIRASNSTRSAPFPPSRIRSRALTRAHFFLHPGFFAREGKKKRIEARTLRIAQTSPFDVHRRLSHVLEMHSQIRASRFARFRRVVGLSGVLDHRVVGKKKIVFFFCRVAFFSSHEREKEEEEVLPFQKKEKKKSKLNPKPYSVLASFLTVVFRFFLKHRRRRRRRRRRLEEEEQTHHHGGPLLSRALPKPPPLFETARVARAPRIGIVATTTTTTTTDDDDVVV